MGGEDRSFTGCSGYRGDYQPHRDHSSAISKLQGECEAKFYARTFPKALK